MLQGMHNSPVGCQCGVKKKKKNTSLTNSNCFTNQVSEAQAQTGLSKGQLLANTTIAALQVLLFCSVDTCPAPNGQKQKSIPQISTAVS